MHAVSDSSSSKGVGILFKENMNVNMIDNFQFMNGRALIVNAEIHGKGFTLANVYAPNEENRRCEFFEQLCE